MSILVFNERSWAIDLISEINRHCRSVSISIKRATGEAGIRADGSTLFPDVVLHGEDSVLQGWELKLPETDLHDSTLLDNAGRKADLLGTNSFLVWNGREAALWVRASPNLAFREAKTWFRIELADRKQVEANRTIWFDMMTEILRDLDFFLQTGVIVKQPRQFVLDREFATKFVESLFEHDARVLEEASLRDETLRRETFEWAADNEIQPAARFNELARLNLLAWLNRFVFCQYLGHFNPIALRVQNISLDTDVSEVKQMFEEISKTMDFANVFATGIGDEIISPVGWSGRIDFNSFLTNCGISDLPEESMRTLLDEFAIASKRKSQGQFATPPQLAAAIAQLAMDDLTAPAIDPCCGSGTIAKAIYLAKSQAGISPANALKSTWASDKHQMPLQLTSMTLSDPSAISSVVQVFKSNVFDLFPNKSIELTDPTAPESKITAQLPKFRAIASNLPFVRQEILDGRGPERVYQELEHSGHSRSVQAFAKADLYAAILIDLKRLLDDSGRVAVVISNSWLGTKWGLLLQDTLREIYNIRAVVISGVEKWFENADVVSTILVLEVKNASREPNLINFVTTLRPLSKWDQAFSESLKTASLLGTSSPDIRVNSVSSATLDHRRKHGFYWRANFFDSNVLEAILSKMEPLSDYFTVSRGARTGQDAFFYPDPSAQATIEPQYLVPLLKSSREFKGLVVSPQSFAFSCSKSLDELDVLGHVGAKSWIERFSNRVNGVGQKLSSTLAKQHDPWYHLSPNETGDFAMSLNPYQSLCVYRAKSPTFMNQRLIRMSVKAGDPGLLHALMNSSVGMLAMEFIGFGRGQGVLDLRNESVQDEMHVLNPGLLTQADADRIKEAFEPLLARDTLPIFEEMKMKDRIYFETTILEAYGLKDHGNEIFTMLLAGVSERVTANAPREVA